MDGIELSDYPAATPPAGVTPNFTDPVSLANLPRVLTFITLPPMVLFLALRIYTRFNFTHMGVDDYLCLLAGAVSVAQIGVMFPILGNPAGPHMWDIPVSKITVAYAQSGVALAPLFEIAAMFIKVSILALCRRLFTPKPLANSLTLGGITFTVVFYTISSVAILVGCIPRASDYPLGGWLSSSYSARCNKFDGPITAAVGIVGVVIDIYVLCVPLFFIWGLNTSSKRKVGVSAVFLVGFIACVFSIIGAFYRVSFDATSASGQDVTWNSMGVYAMNIAEINIGVVCSCMPVVFVLFKMLAEKSLTWATKWYGSKGDRKNNPEHREIRSDEFDPYLELEDKSNLPDVPNGTLTGMRTFVRNMGRTRPYKEKTGISVSDEVILTYASIDYDYHDQLRQVTSAQQPTHAYHSQVLVGK